MVIRFRFQYFIILLLIGVCVFHFMPPEKTTEASAQPSPSSILVIDPGHGGADGGAVGVNGLVESEINLQIALKLESMCKLFGIPTVMTRSTADIDYPAEADTIAKKKSADQKARLQLIHDTPNAILFSIHQNFYPTSSPHGVEVLYGHSDASREVGVLLQQNLSAALCPDNRRVAAEIGQEIYLLRECGCTAALIECGFISNPSEATLLQTEPYQTKIAAVLLGTYLQYTND